jgi:hypothetical protein
MHVLCRAPPGCFFAALNLLATSTIFIIIVITIAATGYWVHTIGVDLPCRLMVDAKIFPTANPKHLSGVWTLNPVPGGNLSKKL